MLLNSRRSKAGIEDKKYLTDREDIFRLRKGVPPLISRGSSRLGEFLTPPIGQDKHALACGTR